MSYPVQLSDLRSRIRLLADAENTSGTGWVGNANLLPHINAAVAKYHNKVVKAVPELYLASETINPDGATASWNLPADWYATFGVEEEAADGKSHRELVRATWDERNHWDTGGGTHRGEAYIVFGSKLYILPMPQTTSGLYTHWYITHAPQLANDSDTVEGHNGWEELIVLYTVMALRIKQEVSISQLMALAKDLEADIATAARNRKAANPPRVADVSPAWLNRSRRRRDPDFWSNR